MNQETNSKSFTNAKIFYRIFPMHKMKWEYLKVLENRKTVFARCLQDTCADEKCIPSYWKFDTDGIFYNDTQKEIYDTIMDGVIERIVKGINVVILNFGQTGCGKTLTATGLSNCYKDRGIALRLISDIFRMKKTLKKKIKMCVQVSYIETKNIFFTDLLSENHDLNLQNLQKVTTNIVKSEYAAMKLLFTAEARRMFVDDSLTSHVANGVFTLTVTTKPLFFSDPIRTTAKVHVVDLGGADFYGSSVSSHKNLMDLRKANLTKTNLDQFMLFLSRTNSQSTSLKQRLDILLHYLSDSFNSRSVLRLIGHIRVEKQNLKVSISMLKFGQILRGIKPTVLRPNLSLDKDLELLYLENKLNEMQKEEDLSYMIKCGEYNISQDRIQQMQTVAMDYLSEETDEIVICNVTDVTTVLEVFKNLYNNLQKDKLESINSAYQSGYQEGQLIALKKESTGSKTYKRSSRTSKVKEQSVTSLKKSSQGSISPKKLSGKIENLGSKVDQGISKSVIQDRASTTTKSIRRSNLSANMRRQSNGKKKSGNGLDVPSLAGVLEEQELPFPTSLPVYTEAWTAFVNDINYNYSELEEEKLTQESNAKAAQVTYLDEVRVLQTCLGLVDIRKSELQRSQMVRLFSKQNLDKDGNAIPSNQEKRCVENLELIRFELINQQEKVLKCQSDFVIALQSYSNAKKNILERFEEYCQKYYQILVPNLDSASVLLVIDKGVDVSCMMENEVSPLVAEEDRISEIYNKFQKFMKTEILKLKLLRKIKSKQNL